MKWIGILVLVVVMLCGCAPTRRYPEGKTTQEFYADEAACMAQGGQASGPFDPYKVAQRRTYNYCMAGQGYTK